MAQEQPPPDPPKKGALTPVQIGAGAGAGATILILLVVNELSKPLGAPPGEPGPIPMFLMGVLAGVGGLLGMAVAALATRRRGPK